VLLSPSAMAVPRLQLSLNSPFSYKKLQESPFSLSFDIEKYGAKRDVFTPQEATLPKKREVRANERALLLAYFLLPYGTDGKMGNPGAAKLLPYASKFSSSPELRNRSNGTDKHSEISPVS
jgi:hypothetical protein